MNKAILMAIACVGIPFPAAAQNSIYDMSTGNDVLAVCTNEGDIEQTLCLAWVAGFVEGVRTMGALSGMHLACFPDGGTYAQYRDIVIAHLQRQPENRHGIAGSLALAALTLAFPCPNSN